MHDEKDIPLTEEEMALARKGEALIASAVADAHAPQSLREAVERDRAGAASRPRASAWRRRVPRLIAAGGAVAAFVAVVIALQGGSDQTAPSLASVEAAAQLDPTGAAPASLGGSPPVLDAKVDALVFPDWESSFGWRAVGRREDNISGRPVTTVVYENSDGARLGYAVVSGEALGDHPGWRQVTRSGNTYAVEGGGGHTIVTWTQQGHTCVIVAPSTVERSRLIDLAASRNV